MAWWAVYSEPQREFLARDELVRGSLVRAGLPHMSLLSDELARIGLSRLGCRVFLPFERVTERRPGRDGLLGKLTTRETSFFQRYLFVEDADFRAVSTTRGVFGVLTNGEGAPHVIPDRDMRKLLDASGNDGLVSALDKTRLSLAFKGRVDDIFAFVGALEGAQGRIETLDRLDTHGEVGVVVEILGGRREINVPHQDVGDIVGVADNRRFAASAAR